MLYESASISVSDATLAGDTGTVFVTFPARTERQGLHRKGFGEDFFKKKGISAILIKAAWNHWFQVPEAEAAMATIAGVTGRFSRVVTYGSSMGGYGAAFFSGRLRASAIIAISPQFSIDRARMPQERRWAEDAARIDFTRDDMAGNINPTADLHVIYDPCTADRLHAERLLSLSQAPRPLLIPFGGHPAGGYLRDTGMLSRVILEIGSGRLVDRATRAGVRAGRPTSALYWSNASTALRRRHVGTARIAAQRAATLAPDNHAVQFQLGRSLSHDGRSAEACEALQRATLLKPSVPKYHLEYGLELLNQGRDAEAELALRAADALAPKEARHKASLATSLLRLGKFEEAEHFAKAAGALGWPAQRVASLLKQVEARTT